MEFGRSCGCTVSIVETNVGKPTEIKVIEIHYCPLHKSAPELYEALGDATAWIRILTHGKGIKIKDYEQVLAKAEVKEVLMPEPKRRHKGETCPYTEDINCQEDTCLNCSTFEKYIKSIP